MAAKGSAPLGAFSDQQRRCMRLLGYDDAGSEILCGAPAAQHIIYRWDEVPPGGDVNDCWDHGFACEEHWVEYQRRWSCAAHHPVDGICGMPGSVYDPAENRCRVDELPTVEPVRAVAVHV